MTSVERDRAETEDYIAHHPGQYHPGRYTRGEHLTEIAARAAIPFLALLVVVLFGFAVFVGGAWWLGGVPR